MSFTRRAAALPLAAAATMACGGTNPAPIAQRSVRVVRTDASGRYRVRGLPPGEHRAFTSVALQGSDVYRREIVEPFVERATSVRLSENASRALDLQLRVPSSGRPSTR